MSKYACCGGCLGSGKYIGYGTEADGKTCPDCQGTGRIKLGFFARLITIGDPD